VNMASLHAVPVPSVAKVLSVSTAEDLSVAKSYLTLWMTGNKNNGPNSPKTSFNLTTKAIPR
jgi:hypothetical protein